MASARVSATPTGTVENEVTAESSRRDRAYTAKREGPRPDASQPVTATNDTMTPAAVSPDEITSRRNGLGRKVRGGGAAVVTGRLLPARPRSGGPPRRPNPRGNVPPVRRAPSPAPRERRPESLRR